MLLVVGVLTNNGVCTSNGVMLIPLPMNLFDKIDFSKPEEIALTQQNTLRVVVGLLGIALPVLLCLCLWLDTGYTKPLQSISHYYFTRVGGIFVIVVSLLAIFLIIYKGNHPVDFILSTVAGACALLLVLFPTSNIDLLSPSCPVSVTTLKESDFRVGLHYFSAAIFLLSLAALSIFVFTQPDDPKRPQVPPTPQKRTRNGFFVGCGIVMVAALVIAFLEVFGLKVFGESTTFWMETVAVVSFGFSWLIKAQVFFKDKDQIQSLASAQ